LELKIDNDDIAYLRCFTVGVHIRGLFRCYHLISVVTYLLAVDFLNINQVF